MEKYRVRRLPVTEDDGSLIGMISQSDLATALPESRTGELVYEISHRNGELAHRIV
jgi:CBS domain-containing protein